MWLIEETQTIWPEQMTQLKDFPTSSLRLSKPSRFGVGKLYLRITKNAQTQNKTRSFISEHVLYTQQTVTQKNHCERKHVPQLKLSLQKRKRTMSKNATQHSPPQEEVKQKQLNKSMGRYLRKKISIEFLV